MTKNKREHCEKIDGYKTMTRDQIRYEALSRSWNELKVEIERYRRLERDWDRFTKRVTLGAGIVLCLLALSVIAGWV